MYLSKTWCKTDRIRGHTSPIIQIAFHSLVLSLNRSGTLCHLIHCTSVYFHHHPQRHAHMDKHPHSCTCQTRNRDTVSSSAICATVERSISQLEHHPHHCPTLGIRRSQPSWSETWVLFQLSLPCLFHCHFHPVSLSILFLPPLHHRHTQICQGCSYSPNLILPSLEVAKT